MSEAAPTMMRLGRAQALAAVVIAGSACWVTVATTTRFPDSAARFVGIGLVIFVMAVVTGSRFAVGGAILIGLIGAVIEIGTVPVQRWERSLIVACLWYVAAELAWDSMERRDGRIRPMTVAHERLREIGTVVVVSLVATVAAVSLFSAAPPRTLVVLAITVGGLALALIVATRHLTATGAATGDSPANIGEPGTRRR